MLLRWGRGEGALLLAGSGDSSGGASASASASPAHADWPATVAGEGVRSLGPKGGNFQGRVVAVSATAGGRRALSGCLDASWSYGGRLFFETASRGINERIISSSKGAAREISAVYRSGGQSVRPRRRLFGGPSRSLQTSKAFKTPLDKVKTAKKINRIPTKQIAGKAESAPGQSAPLRQGASSLYLYRSPGP